MIKTENKSQKSISYRLQFIDNARFMGSTLSNAMNNFAETIFKIKYKYGHGDKKFVESYTKITSVFLNTQTLKKI